MWAMGIIKLQDGMRIKFDFRKNQNDYSKSIGENKFPANMATLLLIPHFFCHVLAHLSLNLLKILCQM